ncbi:helix-turn-helix transcriptional regulator [Actinocorallia aurantiaca]|uniref:Helix-turn-helix transcriptional regulator n=1 Tax=Actinocorallia aurantiaca TaxID=46204 RepID=A0ABN3UEW2_9ACTN
MPYPLAKLHPERSPEERFGAELRRWRVERKLKQPALAARVQVSSALISKIERGVRRCLPELAERLDEILETGGALVSLLNERLSPIRDAEGDSYDAEGDSSEKQAAVFGGRKAIMDSSRAHDEGPVERREFMILAGAAAIGAPSSGLLSALVPSTPPARVTAAEISQIRQAAQLFSGLDHAYGGALVREAVTAQLRWSVQLLSSKCPEKLRTRLLSAVGALAATCGWMAFDDYAHEDARAMLELARKCAEEADDWHLRAKALSHLGRQAVWLQDPDTGLTYIELALVRSDRLTATEQAMLHTARARALAKMVRLGNRSKAEDALRAVGLADAAFSDSDPTADPPWMGYYDEAQHLGDTGHALFDLAAAGLREPRAARRLAFAVKGHSDQYARSRAISGTKLATLIMMTGDPSEAIAVARSALRDAGQVRSRRAATDLAELSSASAPHHREHGVPELRVRINKMVHDA